MERMFGTIEHLFRWFVVPLSSKKKIVLQVRDALRFIRNHGRAYTDLKMENVFFNIYKGHKSGRNMKTPIYPQYLQIKLGDLGSICKPNEVHVTTYPSPLTWKAIYERTTEREWSAVRIFQKCNEYSMVWQLALFVFFIYSITDDGTVEDIFEIVNQLMELVEEENYEEVQQGLNKIQEEIQELKDEGAFGDLPVSNLKKIFSVENTGITLDNIF